MVFTQTFVFMYIIIVLLDFLRYLDLEHNKCWHIFLCSLRFFDKYIYSKYFLSSTTLRCYDLSPTLNVVVLLKGGWCYIFSEIYYNRLSVCFYPDTTQSVPVLISCVKETVTESTNRLLKHLVSMVTIWQAKREHSGSLFKRHVPESIQEKIPKEWNYTPLEVKGKESDNNSEGTLTWRMTYCICFWSH